MGSWWEGRAERCETAHRRSQKRQQGLNRPCHGMGKEETKVFAGSGQEDSFAERRKNICSVWDCLLQPSKQVYTLLYVKACRTIRTWKKSDSSIRLSLCLKQSTKLEFWQVIWIKRIRMHSTSVPRRKVFNFSVSSFSSRHCGFSWNTVVVHFLPLSFLNNFGAQWLSPSSLDILYRFSLSNLWIFSEAFVFEVIESPASTFVVFPSCAFEQGT